MYLFPQCVIVRRCNYLWLVVVVQIVGALFTQDFSMLNIYFRVSRHGKFYLLQNINHGLTNYRGGKL